MNQTGHDKITVTPNKLITCPRCGKTYEIDKDTLFIACICNARFKPIGFFGRTRPRIKTCSSIG